jgi:hypothetical protein
MLYSIKLGDVMNIFILDLDHKKCAEYSFNSYVVKLSLEATQLLNNALIKHDESYDPVYRQSHKNHPASLWASESKDNFDWLTLLSLELCKEYTFRYGKRHVCQNIIEFFSFSSSRNKIPQKGMTPFALCMPDKYKTTDAVNSYRLYVKNEKQHLAKWKNRPTPDWWEGTPII